MDLRAACPRCREEHTWEPSFVVEEELAWAAPEGPALLFRCRCQGLVRIGLRFNLERGSDPRPLRLVGGATPAPARPCILLVDRCPHGCGAKLGLQLEADDPVLASAQLDADEPLVLGGYRCPRCDGEGRLRIVFAVESG